MIVQATQRATEQRWDEARDAYLAAVAHPAFNWIKAELSWDKTPYYVTLALLMAGDYQAHERTCRQIFDSQEVPLSQFHAQTRVVMWLLRPKDRSPEITRQALEFLRYLPDKPNPGHTRFDHWTWRVRGLAAYRQGDLAGAADWFQQALQDAATGDIGCRGPAALYLAMVRHQSGQPDEARQLFRDTEDWLGEPLRTFTGATWNRLCRCALALEEARQVLFRTNSSSPLPGGTSRSC